MNVADIPLAVETAMTFLETLFAPDEFIHFRPIETWTEDGRKKSDVIWTQQFTRKRQELTSLKAISNLMCVASNRRANIFFGVCPRFGGGGHYELAWQVRRPRALWADLDHTTVAAAAERVKTAKLPVPSIAVNSGNGVHLYWLLEEPFVIDDVSDPPPVLSEWAEGVGGKKPRKYIELAGERIYLDERPSVARLSAKALQFQEVLCGIAKAIGGDHTTDLVRLLRLPGSLNRKDQRNGREPIPTELVDCDSHLRYPLSRFKDFKSEPIATAQAKQIAAMPLPTPRKMSAKKADRLAELIAASSLTPVGSRSQTDFAICCFAVRNGVAKEATVVAGGEGRQVR